MFYSSPDSLIKLYHWLEPKVRLCPPAAVVMMCPSQCHPHGREGGADGDQGAQNGAEQLNDQCYEVDQPVRQVAARSRVAQSRHHACDELPERKGCVVGDKVGLRGRECVGIASFP